MDADEDKYTCGGFGAASGFAGGGSAGAVGADEDEYAAGGSGAGGDVGAAGINKDEDIGNGFGGASTGKVSESATKQLKVSKSKILVAIINCKRSYLPKKTMATKLP